MGGHVSRPETGCPEDHMACLQCHRLHALEVPPGSLRPHLADETSARRSAGTESLCFVHGGDFVSWNL